VGGGRPRGSDRRLSEIAARYDRLARVYPYLEPLYLIFGPARRKAVEALGLGPGDVVLEMGCGTGKNFQYLTGAVGPSGGIIGVDASSRSLAEARRLSDTRGWNNIELTQQDVEQLDSNRDVDGVLFSLSYSVIPDPVQAFELAWGRLRPGRRAVIMDAGLEDNRLGRLLDPVTKLLIWLAPGNAHSHPWDDLTAYGTVEMERFLLGIYFVCIVTKPA